ncbi:MAG: DUF1446 domain-containing protein [Gammaproteobacteria bacterium]|nr:DUF1446 domain-containing protein [Gammaproteobacteria bacterium]
MADKILRIGGASGFWGESAAAMPQFLGAGNLDYIVFDYLAEITMSIMARARARDPGLGYATDFVSAMLAPQLSEFAAQKVRIVSNAGGVNPVACAEAIRRLIDDAGLDLKVAVVTGDDLLSRADAFASQQSTEMFTAAPFPAPGTIASINAYLGAFPIARALDRGADIIVTGRVVDSAVTLGACIHEFGWRPEQLDELAGASLAGHILECTGQATGGNFTDWKLTADSMQDAGYPIAEIAENGEFTCTKPGGTGGIVSVGTVSEQLLYEIGDPQAYVLPDVVCDFSQVRLAQTGPDRVRVSGARGLPAPDSYKVSVTYADGYRGGQLLMFYGFDADQKARAYATAALKRAGARLEREHLAPFTETLVEVIGDESHFGEARKVAGSREVAVKVAAKHPDRKGIAVLLQEAIGIALSAPPGLTGFAGGRPRPSPVVRLYSFLLPKAEVSVSIEMNGETLDASDRSGVAFVASDIERPEAPQLALNETMSIVPLVQLAWGRSGDKGDNANIGIIARRREYLPWIWATLTEDVVAQRFAHFLEGPVERFLMPGPAAINFVLHDVLGGGGVASLRNDPQGKGYAQVLLDQPIPLPAPLLETL